MGLFSKKKPTPEKQESPGKEVDSAVRPGGVFMVQLLMREPCAMPGEERMTEVLTNHLGRVEPFGSRSVAVGYAAWEYMAEFKDGKLPVQLSICECDAFQAERIDGMKRSQMWDCKGRQDQILAECSHAVLAHDMLGGGLSMQKRANMLMDYLEALLELYPSCEAVYFLNSGKLVLADTIRKKALSGLERFIRFAVNVRFFNVNGTDDHVIDTLGLSLLYIEDLQYHFHGMDPNWVVGHAYNMASYLLNNDRPVKNGDTIDGVAEGRLEQSVQWPCHFEDALIEPRRPVLDVCMGEFAAGRRQ